MPKLDTNDVGAARGPEGLASKLDELTAAAPPVLIGNDWPDVAPLGVTGEPPPFPAGIFPPWLETFKSEVTRALEVPPDLAGFCALGVLAIAFQKRYAVRVNTGFLEPLSLDLVCGLEPGSLKSPTFKLFLWPVFEYERRERERLAPEILEGERKRDLLLKQIASLQTKMVQKGTANGDLDRAYCELDALKIPVAPLLTAGDITPEAIGGLLVTQAGRLSVASAEGAFLEILRGRYNDAPAIEVVLQGHAGEVLKVHRASKDKPPVMLTTPAVSLLFTIQPCLIATFTKNATLAGRGLLSRIVFGLPTSTLGHRRHDQAPVSAAVQGAYDAKITEFLKLPEHKDKAGEIEAQEIPCEARVTAALRNFKRVLEPELKAGGRYRDRDGYLSGFAGKAPGLALRVAGLLALADGRPEVLLADFERGARFTEYALEHATRVAQLVSEDPATSDAKRVLSWIQRNVKPETREFDRRDVCRNLNLKADEAAPVLGLLVEHDYIRPRETVATKGPGRRPTPGGQLFTVNPKAWAQWEHER